MAETSANCVVPPQSSGCRPSAGELALDAVEVRVGEVDLVDGDDDRNPGSARMGDRLARLRHHAVVRRDDENRDVGHLGTAGAHRRERLVARGVEERDLAPVDVCLVRADVLRDPTRLGLDDRRLPDRVEQRRLAVVDVTHDRHHRRARRQIRRVVFEHLRLVVVVGRMLDRHLALELGGDQPDLVVAERLRDRLPWPSRIRNVMIWGAEIPSACDRFWIVTPDSTVTGPVGATACCWRG